MVISYFGNIQDNSINQILQDKIKFFGITYLAVELPKSELPANHISRLTLSERKMKQHEIKRQIQNERRNYDLIIVEPTSAGTASFAARDNRVDYIRLYPKLGLHTLNKRYASRLMENETMIEIDLSMYFDKYLARRLRPLMRILETFETSDIPVWLTNLPNNPMQLRSYKGLQSLGRLIGLSNKKTQSKWVISRVERNRKKLSGEIPFPGVEIDGSQD